ncbi:protein of unknown function DUF167 [Thermodesulfatator indicus DSM 15286]|uniref:UPF0235 protein Thein_1774 n=1 Tax=Thermodesulfatator indicus (strain DSM 15286 / JCM 11887 / CIR29812) TaxID=667014 RepID=F8ABM9_THEID|nr:DUF167 domain-containing protein [Thermodesulfatator indicus]AEH45630.1 protein of unknown function DUF167 [Thermodesulfatator indicus DSM 15286]
MLEKYEKGFLLSIYLQPKAKKEEIVGFYQEALKIKVKSPPVDGKANEALISFLAKKLGLSKKNLKLLAGFTSKHKKVYIEGLEEKEIKKRLGIVNDAIK